MGKHDGRPWLQVQRRMPADRRLGGTHRKAKGCAVVALLMLAGVAGLGLIAAGLAVYV